MSQTETHNRYDILTQEVHRAEHDERPQPPKNHKPPPVFLHGVINYSEMIKSISEVAEDEQYFTKSMANNVIKLTCSTADTYRNFVKHFKEKGMYYHTYQLMEEKAYRVVLKYLHHTTEVEDIQQELFALGHVARNIVKVQHRLTKEILNLFFVDLEPANDNKDIQNITNIQNKIIHVEPPREGQGRTTAYFIAWCGANRCSISVPIMLGSVVNGDPENFPCRQSIKPHNITKRSDAFSYIPICIPLDSPIWCAAPVS
jgi:hypothetical protein